MLTQATKRCSTKCRANRVACFSELQVVRTTILSVMRGRSLGFARLRQFGESFLYRVDILGVGGDCQVLFVRFACLAQFAQLLVGFAQLEECLGRHGVPFAGFEVPPLGRPVVALLEIEVAGRDVAARLKRIERIDFGLEIGIFFGRFLFLNRRSGGRSGGRRLRLRRQQSCQNEAQQ